MVFIDENQFNPDPAYKTIVIQSEIIIDAYEFTIYLRLC